MMRRPPRSALSPYTSLFRSAPAGERWNWALATPEPGSAELEETATAAPRTLAAEAGAGIAPGGVVEALTMGKTWVLVLAAPAASGIVLSAAVGGGGVPPGHE